MLFQLFATRINNTSGTSGIFKHFAKGKTHFLPISVLKFQN
jgi:hypothetical protein